MRRTCSPQADLGQGSGVELRRSPAVLFHPHASTRPTVSPAPGGPVWGNTQLLAAEKFGPTGRACLYPAFLHLRFYSTLGSGSTLRSWTIAGRTGAGKAVHQLG